MPPTIPRFTESNNQLPSAPPATDINPERFGRADAALANLGGEIGQLGGKLMEVRKRAIESDAVASGQTDLLLSFSKMEEEEKEKYQQDIKNSNGDISAVPDMSERLKKRMEDSINERAKRMPTGDAQQAFVDRITPIATRSFIGNRSWENETRAKAMLGNYDTKFNLVSQDIQKNPSLARTIDHIISLKQDVDSKTGTLLDQDQAEKVFKSMGKGYAASMFTGLADGTETDSKYGRELLKKMPSEMAELFDAEDIRKIENRFDQGDHERKQQFEIDKAAKKEALEIRRDQVQGELLSEIEEGRATVKDILKGKGAILDPDKQEHMLGVLKRRQFEPKVPSANAMRSVVDRIHADPSDPRRITNEDQLLKVYKDGGMTFAQLNQARKELGGRSTVAGQVDFDLKKQLFKQAEAALVKKDPMGMADPDGQEHYAQFMSYALEKLESAKKDGKNPRDLLDANSKDYLGNAIGNYRRTPVQVLKAQVERMKNMKREAGAPVPQEKQDSKIADYAKQNGLDYGKAESILRKRGYGK